MGTPKLSAFSLGGFSLSCLHFFHPIGLQLLNQKMSKKGLSSDLTPFMHKQTPFADVPGKGPKLNTKVK